MVAKRRQKSREETQIPAAPALKWLPIPEDIDAECACPICGNEYYPPEVACMHQLADWCFSTDVEAGSERGNWPTKSGGRVLARFDKAMYTLSDILDNWEWPSDDAHAAIRDAVPEHLRDDLGRSWEDLLNERIAAAPGYYGSHEITTNSMASDDWCVHWAKNARIAARPVIAAFREDLATIVPIVRKARKIAKP